jgi:hypothetical protein
MRKTIVLWVVLIVFFVAFYRAFSNGQGGINFSGLGFAPWAIVAAVFTGVVVWGRRQRRINQLSTDGAELLNRGRCAEALAKFEEFRRRSRSPIGPYNVGVARLWLWQFDEAARELEAARKGAKQVPAVAAGIPIVLGLVNAMQGDRNAAENAFASIDAKLKDSGQVLLLQGVLACRTGDFTKARQLFARHEIKQLGGFHGALANALNAWCIEQTQGELRHVDRIALFGETGPERLKAAWPELAAFVERAPAA